MSQQSNIEWLHRPQPDGSVVKGHTSNPWTSCSHAVLPDGTPHPGCLNCYAEAFSKRNPKTIGTWGPDGTRVFHPPFFENCRKWNRQAAKLGVRVPVFPSMCDPFEDWDGVISDTDGNWWHHCTSCKNPDGCYAREAVKPYDRLKKYYEHACGEQFFRLSMDDIRRDLFTLIDECQCLDFLLLTKRPQNVRRMWPMTRCPFCDSNPCVHLDECGSMTAVQHWEAIHKTCRSSNYRENVWLLTSVSDQSTADAMIPELLTSRRLVPVLGVSAEPLLTAVNFQRWLKPPCWESQYSEEEWLHRDDCPCRWTGKVPPELDWLIVGGESGQNHRVCEVSAITSIVDQCREAGVPCFVKQDCGPRPGMQGRLSDDVWSVKQFPSVKEPTHA